MMISAKSRDLEHALRIVPRVVHRETIGLIAISHLADIGPLELAAAHGLLCFLLGEDDFRVTLSVACDGFPIARSTAF